jgi:predicted 2-oxoglutarate/Fe(II)-dependent dioxygenase YbiX
MILFEKKLFNESECEYIKGLGGEFVQSYFKAGNKNEVGYNLKKRNSFVTNASLTKDDFLFKKINDSFKEIGYTIDVDTLPFEIYKYNDGNFITKHIDSDPFEHNRFCVCVVQLSNPTNYEGGTFLSYINDESIPMNKEIGNFLVITPDTPHEVEVITSGERKSMIIAIVNENVKPTTKKSFI